MIYILLDERKRITIRIEGWSCAREFGVERNRGRPWSRLLLRILCNIWEITGKGGGGVEWTPRREDIVSFIPPYPSLPFGKFIDEGVISV